MKRPSTDKEHRQQDIVTAVAQHLVENGMHNSALRALAKSVGMSDRMLMYYFETKEELIAQALLQIAGGLVGALENALPRGQVSGQQILDALRLMGQDPAAHPGQKLWFEIIGLAMRNEGPYKTTAKQILDGMEDWIKNRLGSKRAHLAPAILAQAEGEMMINLLRLPD
ncbi:MAG: TetR/AcrR family transcriptional regulator [Pseudomonadales bacterium]|nr:TetR/AcrR family transcriptional regulator [Pseudomonadales bacterium]